VLTAPLVFQLTYADAESKGGLDTSSDVWKHYIVGQVAYALVVVGMWAIIRAYRRWLASL
jgi:hypothetical protein